VVVIAADVEDPDMIEALMRRITIKLKPEATAKELVLCPTNNWTTMTGSTMLGSCHDLRPRLPSRKLPNSNFDSGRRPLGHRSRSPYEVRLC